MRIKTIGFIVFALFIASLTAQHSHSHSGDNTHSHSHDEEIPKVTPKPKPIIVSQNDLWFQALVATAFIGVAPILILFFIPLIKKERGSEEVSVNIPLLKTLLSFAVGGLLGDVFLHLLPHAMEAQSHDEEFHSHSHNKGESGHDHHHDLSLGLLILGGIMTFFLIEKIMRISSGNAAHSHSHEEKDKTEKKSKKKEEKKGHSVPESKKVTGYLNIIADTAHNFTDGMAIAASFLVSPKLGIGTTIGVFFHEIPHEIGDYAILIQSGFSKNQAMMVQLWTAFGAIGGCIVGLIAGGYVESVNWILPFTAGGFIYIAIANVIPELLENSSVKQTIAELIGICLGITMMSFIALNE